MAVYAIDGTWNDERNGEVERWTNVRDFVEAFDGKAIFYKKGVGTKLGWFGKIAGGIFGIGGHERVSDAYDDICTQFEAGDHEIVIVGFSRGAALALDLANKLYKDGIRTPGTRTVVLREPPIAFLGLFDVVGSFGIPGNPVNIGHHLKCPPNVVQCAHAMALDEKRRTFPVTRLPPALEVWFRGGHSDVGGGNENPKINNISLRWMCFKARKAGVRINDARVPTDQDIDVGHELKVKWSLWPDRRTCREGDRIHYTVAERGTRDVTLPTVLVEDRTAEAFTGGPT